MDRVGEYLKKERKSRGVTIEEICDTTRIAKYFVVAMEEGRFEDMPGETLVIGFLRNYSRAIGVNSDEVISKYHEYVKDKEKVLLPENQEGDEKDGMSRKNIFLMIFVFFLLMLTSVLLKKCDDKELQVVKKTEVDEVAVSPDKELLTIKATEDAWISIVIDGSKVKDIVLKKGSEVSYRGKENFLFTTGNLKGVEVTHNGQPISFPSTGKNILKNYLITSLKE